MKNRLVIGYILLNIGIIIGAISVIINLIENIILKFDPDAFYAGVHIGTGFTWLLFIIPGSILARKSEKLLKKIIGVIIILLGIIPILVDVLLIGTDLIIIIIFFLPIVLFYLIPGILLVSNIKAKFIIGYNLLIYGIIGAIILAFVYVKLWLSPPQSLIGAVLGTVFAWIFYNFYSVFIALGSIMIMEHKYFPKKSLGIIVILLGIIPQIVIFVDLLAQQLREFKLWLAHPISLEPELYLFDVLRILLVTLLCLLPPFVLYLIPGMLLLKSSKQNRSG
jgi:hypothetical protein